MSGFKGLAIMMFGGLLVLLIMIFTLPTLASAAVFTTATSAVLVSTRDSMNSLLPWLFLMRVSAAMLSVSFGRK